MKYLKIFFCLFCLVILGTMLIACDGPEWRNEDVTIKIINYYKDPITRIVIPRFYDKNVNIVDTEIIKFKYGEWNDWGSCHFNLFINNQEIEYFHSPGYHNHKYIEFILLSDGTGVTKPMENVTIGTFQIRINGLSPSFIQDIQDGYLIIYLYPSKQVSIPDSFFGINDTSKPGAVIDYESGVDLFGQWFSFYFYRINSLNKVLGSTKNYDLVIKINGGNNIGIERVLNNIELNVDQMNSLAYSLFIDL